MRQAVFHQSMNSVYADELGLFAVVYLDDVLVYSKSKAEHAGAPVHITAKAAVPQAARRAE